MSGSRPKQNPIVRAENTALRDTATDNINVGERPVQTSQD